MSKTNIYRFGQVAKKKSKVISALSVFALVAGVIATTLLSGQTQPVLAAPGDRSLEYYAPGRIDLRTAEYIQPLDLGVITGERNASPDTFAFNNDGTLLIVEGTHTPTGVDVNRIKTFELDSPYDVSTATEISDIDLATIDSSLGVNGNPYMAIGAIDFNPDGSRMYLLVQGDGGSEDAVLREYTLGSNYDVSTMSSSPINLTTLNDNNVVASCLGARENIQYVSGRFTEDGLYYLATNGGNTNTNIIGGSIPGRNICGYPVGTAYDISTFGTVEQYNNPASHAAPVGAVFSRDGSQVITVGDGIDDVFEYQLETPFDVTTAVEEYERRDEGTKLTDVMFNQGQTKMFLLDKDSDRVYEYDLKPQHLRETDANDGSIDNSDPIGIKLHGDTFADGDNDDVLDPAVYTINNVPAGLTPVMTLSDGDTFATLTFTGTANDHDWDDDVDELTFEFTDSAFTAGDAANVYQSGDAVAHTMGLGMGIGFGDAPANVPDSLELWLKADTGFSTDATELAIWEDLWSEGFQLTAENVKNVSGGGDTAPTLSPEGLNFNDTIFFVEDSGVSTERGEVDFDFSEFSTFSVQTSDGSDSDTVWMYSSNGENTLGLWTDSSDHEYTVDHVSNSPQIPVDVTNGTPYMTSFLSDNASTEEAYLNGVEVSSGAGAPVIGGRGCFGVGFDQGDTGLDGECFDSDNHHKGDIAEILIYSGKLGTTQRRQIESYLGLKYGITLDQSTAQNYLASDGSTTMWDATIGTGFDNDIFGVGRDDDGRLGQIKSKSVNTDGLVTVLAEGESSADNNAPTNYSFTDIDDKEFLTIGNDNGGEGAEAWTFTGAPLGFQLLNREWSVQETGDVGSVTIGVDVANTEFNVPATTVVNTPYFIVVDSDNDGDFADESPQAFTDQGSDYWTRSGVQFDTTLGADSTMSFTLASLDGGITGTVYTDEGVANIGINKTVRLLVDGVDTGLTDETSADGVYLIDGPAVAALTGSEVLTLYIDDEPENGVTVTTADGPAMGGIDIWQNYLNARSDNGGTLSGAELNLADNVDPGSETDDITSVFIMDGSNNLTTTNGSGVYVPTSQSLTLGATLDIEGSLLVDGTVDVAATTTNVGGDFIVDATTGAFTDLAGGGIVLDGSAAQNYNQGAAVINANVTITNTSADVLVTESAMSVNDLTINDDATLVLAGNNLTVAGTFMNGTTAGNTGSTVRLQGDETVSLTQDIDSGTWEYAGDGTVAATTHTLQDFGITDYYNLVINDVSATNSDTFESGADLDVVANLTVTDGTIKLDDGTDLFADIDGNLLVEANGTADLSATDMTLAGNFTNQGTVIATSGTVQLDGDDQTVDGDTGFYSLSKSALTGGSTLTFTDGTDITVADALVLDGSVGNLLTINADSTSPASTPTIDMTGTPDFNGNYLEIRDNTLLDNSTGLTLPADPANSVDLANTALGWFGNLTIEFVSPFSSDAEASGGNMTQIRVIGHQIATPRTVEINLLPGSTTATSGTDFSYTNATFSIPAGNYSSIQNVSFTTPVITNDTKLEQDETVALYLENEGPGVVVDDVNTDFNTAQGFFYTINDDDTATVSITATDDTATENPETNGEFTVTIDRSNDSGGPITVTYTVNASSTAVSGSDYVALSGTVDITDGQDSATISVDTTALDDALTDGNVDVDVDVVSTNFATVTATSPTSATVTIYDDETDTDGDGVPDAQEIVDGTDVNDIDEFMDTDGDGVPDYVELNDVPPTDPNNGTDYTDTDGDGVPDYVESRDGTNPSDPDDFKDTDGAGTSDYAETTLLPNLGLPATDPNDPNDDDTDLDGVSDTDENVAPGGDGNGDGIQDAVQGEVSSKANPVTGAHVTLEASGGCSFINGYTVVAESQLDVPDADFEYPVGLNDFQLRCSTPGQSADVTFYYDQEYDASDWSFKKYDENGDEYSDITDIATFAAADVNGTSVTTVSYEVTDGGITDVDGLVDGFINDPAGPAVQAATEDLSETGSAAWLLPVSGAVLMLSALAVSRRKSATKEQ